ncbi:hypothetical protein BV25DRAFT_1823835 [Artomyces pyxidatus]|uniref:Uncharacterized protein n=1 Tax=Artomyces pyxidatus TaxID=48021 RepID=A0ACB8T6Q3_9AGAM|nr:hypothetical protein BV25DRAFT_1823835 [Artomyces pyxidatus]
MPLVLCLRCASRSPSASPEPASHLPDNRVRVHVRKLNNCDAYARWFSSRGAVKLELPRECPERPTETDLYIHQWGDGDVQAWITKEGKWAVIVSGATHPSEAEPWSGRRFFVTADGKPAWLLDNSYKNKVRELERELTPLPGEGILAF